MRRTESIQARPDRPFAYFGRLIGLFEAIPHSLIALLARLSIAMTFWQSGQTKVVGWHVTDSAIFLFENEYKRREGTKADESILRSLFKIDPSDSV